ncbi:dinitrogenase iron-molybdenum cofactor, partial [Candidatus Woesearchaeota archaeon]
VEAESPDKINLVKVIDNPNVNVGGGAGISTAQLAANENVEAIITGNIGPRAFGVMQQLNIKVYRATGKAIDAVKQLLEGKLEEITIPEPMWK